MEADYRHYCEQLYSLPVNEIAIEHVLAALKTATKTTIVRDRARRIIEAVLDAAKVRGLRSGENPAAWRGNLEHLLPQSKRSGHDITMDYREVPSLSYGCAQSRPKTAGRRDRIGILDFNRDAGQ